MDVGQYEIDGRATYSAFAAVVASILTAAITRQPSYRLQVVTHRAKDVESLKKKLAQRNKSSTQVLESDIKDLAGCRVIFYTNGDVSRFMSSQIMSDNFDVVEIKIHQPKSKIERNSTLYTASHYIVCLGKGRATLPEYSRFEGLHCEVQVHTILNHSWSEMEHDTIYKSPDFNGIGEQALEKVRLRLDEVMQEYLVPAGYQFDKIANDFERIIKGKKLFDEGALDEIVSSVDNNRRAEALETFRHHVLPYYDDVKREFPLIVEKLVEAVGIARKTEPVRNETPFGDMRAVTSANIVVAVAEIVRVYRYTDIDLTFETACDLFAKALNDDERKPLYALGEALAHHEMVVWNSVGPAIQAKIVERIAALNDDYRLSVWPLLVCMLREILKPEITGSTNASNSVTLHGMAVVPSSDLATIRERAVTILKNQFAESQSLDEKWNILSALEESTRRPRSSNYSYDNDLALLVAESTAGLLDFETEKLGEFSFEMLQSVEERALSLFRTYSKLPESMSSDDRLFDIAQKIVTSALAYRDAANANSDFVTYKTLVGFRSVFPPAWENPDFSVSSAKAYREAAVKKMADSVNMETAEHWFRTITCCSETQSNDLATFPAFAKFLELAGRKEPEIVLDYIDRMGPDLSRFLPAMIAGLLKCEHSAVSLRLDQWIKDGEHLGSIAKVLWRVDPFDEGLLCRVLKTAMRVDDVSAVKEVIVTAERQFREVPGNLVNAVFFPAFEFLISKGDMSWINMARVHWFDSPILMALDEEQASAVLTALVPYPQIEHDSEYVVAAIAAQWPALVVDFFSWRLGYPEKKRPERYQELPYSLGQLAAPLLTVRDYLLKSARKWANQDDVRFQHFGSRFVASVFGDIDADLKSSLEAYIIAGDQNDIEFVLDVLDAFEGKPGVFELVKEIVAQADLSGSQVESAASVLRSSEGWCGEFGRGNLLEERMMLVISWLDDPRKSVQKFANYFIQNAKLDIARERQAALASIASRRLDYDEKIDDL